VNTEEKITILTDATVNAAVEGAVKLMMDKMITAGYSDTEIIAYMQSDDGIRNVLRYGEAGLKYIARKA
jgi:hypothetical protein